MHDSSFCRRVLWSPVLLLAMVSPPLATAKLDIAAATFPRGERVPQHHSSAALSSGATSPPTPSAELSSPWPYKCSAGVNATEIGELVDASGLVVVVTGADGHIGTEIVTSLALANATTVMVCRDPTSCESAKQAIEASLVDAPGTVGPISTSQVDLANFTSVAACAADIASRYDHVDVLLNNAGTISQTLSVDGLVLTLQVNHYGHALLTELLLPTLLSPSPTGRMPRVVNTASANAWGPFTDLDNQSLKYTSLEEIATSWSTNASALSDIAAYSTSKFLVIQYAYEMAQRYKSQLAVFSVSPGYARDVPVPPSDCLLGGLLFTPCPMSYMQGATPEVFASIMPGIEMASGAYFDFMTKINLKLGKFIQTNPNCSPQNLPGWLGVDGTDIMWTDEDRSQWYEIVQNLIGPYERGA